MCRERSIALGDLVRVSLSIDESLFGRLEELVDKSSYTNRSEFIRDMIRDRLVDEEWRSSDQTLLGTISLVYDHHVRQLSEKLTHQQHHFAGKVLATTHVHLDRKLCAEMIMVHGSGTEIRELVDSMRRQKGVLHAKLAIGSTGQKLV